MRFSISFPHSSEHRPAAAEQSREYGYEAKASPPEERLPVAQPLPDDLDERVRLVGEW